MIYDLEREGVWRERGKLYTRENEDGDIRARERGGNVQYTRHREGEKKGVIYEIERGNQRANEK